jgi:hypothetical protein
VYTERTLFPIYLFLININRSRVISRIDDEQIPNTATQKRKKEKEENESDKIEDHHEMKQSGQEPRELHVYVHYVLYYCTVRNRYQLFFPIVPNAFHPVTWQQRMLNWKGPAQLFCV